MYDDLAEWFPLLTPPEEYAEEAAWCVRALRGVARGPVGTVLELGSGGGHMASHYAPEFEAVTLVDLSERMLAASGALNPRCEHLPGDMRSLRLRRRFDAVILHDAVMYMTTEEELRRAVETVFAHCRPGGAAIVAPDCVTESFRPGTSHGGHDEGDRGMRYLEWVHDPDPGDTTYLCDFAFLLAEGGRPPRVFQDRHVMGLFPRATWLRLLGETGFRVVDPSDPSPSGPGGSLEDVFLCTRPE
jgi:SAM-dependent methyltransferase